MANNKSSKKRIKIANRNHFQNRYIKSSVKTLTKIILKKKENSNNLKIDINKKKLKDLVNLTYSLIDKGTKKNIFHKNTAARKKSNISLLIHEKIYLKT